MSPDLRAVPSFIGIGMAKSGTSWLDVALRHHPQLWMPPLKELHFFDDYFKLVRKGDPSRYFSAGRFSRARWRRYLVSETKRALRHPSGAAWAWRFLAMERNFDNYARLFAPAKGRVCGEITPDYAVLDAADIRAIRERFPWLKIVLVLRNPVERAWSHAKMQLAARRDREVADIPAEELERFLFEDEGVAARACYASILANWNAAFGREQVFVALYDEIRVSPLPLMRRLFRFLGVDSDVPLPEELGKVVFRGSEGRMPAELRQRLSARYLDEVEQLAVALERPTLRSEWLPG